MVKLIQNECLKLHAKKGIYILMGILIGLEIIIAVGVKQWAPSEMQPSGYGSFTNSMFDFIFLIVTIFGIILATRSITEEFQKGTIKQLLIRPRKRVTVLFSKYITIALVVTVILFIAFMVSVLIGMVVFGGEKEGLTVAVLMKKFMYEIISVLFFITLAFCLANIFRKSVLPLVMTLFIFFLKGTINTVLMILAEGVAKFSVFSHLDLSVYDSNEFINAGMKPPFAGFTFTTSLLIDIVYFAILLIVSSALFQKRDVL
ncbi:MULTISPECIES: ABC transporter permease [Bacillus cereus group]|uniref:Bacitracin transport permease protein BCRB n=1 Tax=Bacillus cytotoxicus (strain DSM 22905 / CIP 110041 / 391-98 / NVH 391-98) TaxID=315749 RepID=A7GMP9_BACCN|nr:MULTISPECIES: ABC transporter permease [Bacillus cereus group]ABS21407.1 bacitracin transport permease protein BCRB [Bacillus cytotoxicus NVH 391-98]AWC44117.1 ABC transporter permease [Bacillus cytotoxicus]MDH2862768.1 ABC transporter permease [Bacillus cytotoxicus]MDH2883303.1 ABC transporter permease [Bacillus cytotoxicus]NZD31528.1 ABC transporter permease [Bacillus cytotoxicus]